MMAGASRTWAASAGITCSASRCTPRRVLEENDRWNSSPKAGVGGGDAADLPWHVVVQGAERAQVGEAGAVAGGEQDGVGLLACSIGPGDAAGVKASEHGTADHAPGVQGAGVFAGVKHGAAAEVAGQPFGREQVE